MYASSKNYQQQNKINRCFFVKNIHQTPFNIEKLTLFYTLKKETSLKTLVCHSTLLEIITQQRACFTRSKKSSIFLKIRKGVPLGVKVTLRKEKKRAFLTSLIWNVLPNMKNFEKNSKFYGLEKDSLNSLVFVLSDPLIFSELKDFYFYFKSCVDLRILISFSKGLKKKEIFFNSRFSQIPLI